MTNTGKTKLIAVNELGYRIGTSHHNCKVPDAIIDQIRDLHEEQGWSYSRISEYVGFPKDYIAKVCRYERRAQTPERWKRVKDDQG